MKLKPTNPNSILHPQSSYFVVSKLMGAKRLHSNSTLPVRHHGGFPVAEWFETLAPEVYAVSVGLLVRAPSLLGHVILRPPSYRREGCITCLMYFNERSKCAYGRILTITIDASSNRYPVPWSCLCNHLTLNSLSKQHSKMFSLCLSS